MIVAENPKPSTDEFRALMSRVDILLNEEASANPSFFSSKSGLALEPAIRDVAVECAKHTKFEGSINLVSGASFPDIVAAKYYGIEVKSTQQNHWTSIGSSILESTRIPDVERIYLTFGKLGDPIQFMSRPYEECLSGIAVTHYPRYQIDMNLKPGESIFHKMGIPYDTLRKMDNPVEPVASYYRSKLREGESLWWSGGATEAVEASVPATVRLWTSLSPEEKDYYEACSYVYFPECIMSSSSKKYNRATLWLATQCGIINSNVRDSFSAGGQVRMQTSDGIVVTMPRIFKNIQTHIIEIKDALFNTEPGKLNDFWREPINNNRMRQWIGLVAKEALTPNDRNVAESVLTRVFTENGLH
jgi:hypothetical protein